MRGQLLHYDTLAARGTVTGEDGQRYEFAGSEWRSPPQQLLPGAPVDFTPQGTEATSVFLANAQQGYGGQPSYGAQPGYGAPPGGPGYPPPSYGSPEKSNVAAGLLAFFLGSWGIHKFYLGYNTEGAILLGAWFVSLILCIVIIGIFGLMAIGIVTLVEAIIYLTTPQDRFTQVYVLNRRPWF